MSNNIHVSNIQDFLQHSYSDQKLVELLNAAENNELRAFNPNKCLLGRSDEGYRFHRPKKSRGFGPAESEFMALFPGGWPWQIWASRKTLNRRMLPIIQFEISRRAMSEKPCNSVPSAEAVAK